MSTLSTPTEAEGERSPERGGLPTQYAQGVTEEDSPDDTRESGTRAVPSAKRPERREGEPQSSPEPSACKQRPSPVHPATESRIWEKSILRAYQGKESRKKMAFPESEAEAPGRRETGPEYKGTPQESRGAYCALSHSRAEDRSAQKAKEQAQRPRAPAMP